MVTKPTTGPDRTGGRSSEGPEAGGVSGGSRRSRWADGARRALVVIGWVVVGLLGLVAVLRLVAWDSIQPLIVLDALSMLVYLPAWIVAVGALVGRRWWLAGAALLVVVAQVVFVAPEFLAATPTPAWSVRAPELRLFDANIDKSLTFEAGWVHAIEADRADVVTLEEFTPPALQAMVASGVLDPYPYRCTDPPSAPPASSSPRACRWPGAGSCRWRGTAAGCTTWWRRR